jgi:hypothetical protein
MKQEEIQNLDFSKLNGLIPAVVIDAKNNQVLMLGFMNFMKRGLLPSSAGQGRRCGQKEKLQAITCMLLISFLIVIMMPLL